MAYDDLPLQCPTCRFNIMVRATVAGLLKESRGCWRHISAFPDARTCHGYEREPGSDDE